MDDKQKPVGLMVRLPPELHEQIVKFAQGTTTRPPTSMNLAIIFLLRTGLAQLEKLERGDEGGNSVPVLLVA